MFIHTLSFQPGQCGTSNFLMTFKLYQNSRSLWAVAGFAIAIVFSWRLFRSPSGHQRRQHKRQFPTSGSSGISSNSNAALPSEVASSSEDTRAQYVIDEFFQPVKVSVEIIYLLYPVIHIAWLLI